MIVIEVGCIDMMLCCVKAVYFVDSVLEGGFVRLHAT
jgi:hypothetical protein